MLLLASSGDTALAVPIIAIIFTFLWLMLKTVMAPFTARANREAASAGSLSEEEQAILEKLQRTLAQMEERVEALETILIEQSRSKEKV